MLPLATTLLAATLAAGLEIRPASAKPGDAILLVVPDVADEPAATVEGREVRFWRVAGGWRAIAGLPVEVKPGPLAVKGRAGGRAIEGTVAVVDPAFLSRELTLPPQYVEPPASMRERIAADQRAFNAAFSRAFAAPELDQPFDWPIVSETTGHYGDKRTYKGKQQGQHYGLDLDAAMGAPIHASNDGLAVMVRDTYYAGLAVVLWHGADLYTAYFHLSKAEVKAGQAVKRGETIGLAGASGKATGPHLHWGAKVAGRWVDPESVMRLGAFARDAREAAPTGR